MQGVIKRLNFSVLSPKDILDMSVVEVNTTKMLNKKDDSKNSVFDERLGMSIADMTDVEDSKQKSCVTCKLPAEECTGHFGHIILKYPVFNSLFEKEILKILTLFCFSCCRLIKQHEGLSGSFFGQHPPEISFEKLAKMVDSREICTHCGLTQPYWYYGEEKMSIIMFFKKDSVLENTPRDIQIRFETLNRQDLERIGISHPQNLIISVLPVLPCSARPSLISDGKICFDDLTIQYVEIVKMNNKISSDKPFEDQRKEIKTLIFRISSLFNNSSGKSKYTTGKTLKGIKERMTGKEAVVRGNLMGKRVEQSGRTVIGPEPTLLMNQIALPEEMAQILTFTERVCVYNIDKLTRFLEQGKINIIQRGDKVISVKHNRSKNLRLEYGDHVHRQIMDGDPILTNRQPTLHKGSMISFSAVVSKGKTIRFNLCNTKTFNADFDGDEANIHVPQHYNTRCELSECSSVQNHILSEKNGSANIVLVQDNILALYLMTHEDDVVEREELFDLTLVLVDEAGKPMDLSNILKRIDQIQEKLDPKSGRGVVSLCFPCDFCFSTEDYCIDKGVFVSGDCNKKVMTQLIKILYHTYDAEKVMMIINNLQFITNAWLELRGFSVGVEDCMLEDPERYEMVKQNIAESFTVASAVKSRIQHEKIQEIRVQEALNKARDLGMKIAKQGFRKGNRFVSMIQSGSKGDFFNIAQISGLLGQQYYKGQRIKCMLNNGTRSLYHYPFEIEEDKVLYESRGFVRHCFLGGLSPREMFFHAVAGRSGIVDTAMGTADTGYMQRRMTKLMEDIHVGYNGTVVDDMGSIYQYVYGNGFDPVTAPSKTIRIIVDKLNASG